MLWSKLCKSAWISPESMHGTLRFLFLSHILYGICIKIFNYESVYFKELRNDQEYFWPTKVIQGGSALALTTSSLCMWFSWTKIIRWNLTNTDTKRTFINRVPVSSGHSKNLMDAWFIEMKMKAVILKREICLINQCPYWAG